MNATIPQPTIGIDGSRATVGKPTGTERYAIELLGAMANLDPADPIRVYFNQPQPPPGIAYPGEAVMLPGPRFWTLRTLAQEMRRNPPGLLFVPSYVIPPFHPRAVVTIHDLGYLIEPKSHEPIHRKQLEWTTRWNVRAASGIIAISQTTRRDLIERLEVPPETIRVIPHGVSSDFQPASETAIADLRSQLQLHSRFILAVGTIQPRKNLVRLIQAFEHLAASDRDLELVICGNSGWRADEILERARRSPFAARIRSLGYVDDAQMPILYSAAAVTAFVSLYEGFGLPALESMACGTPVLAANRSALPEICGDAAELVDPFDVDSIASELRQLLENSAVRQIRIDRGTKHAACFTWRSTARETLAFLRAIRDNSS